MSMPYQNPAVDAEIAKLIAADEKKRVAGLPVTTMPAGKDLLPFTGSSLKGVPSQSPMGTPAELIAQLSKITGMPEEQVRLLFSSGQAPQDAMAAMQAGAPTQAPGAGPTSMGPAPEGPMLGAMATDSGGGGGGAPVDDTTTPPAETVSAPIEVPPAGPPAEVVDTSGNLPDTGWSSTVNRDLLDQLGNDPVQAERVRMRQEGLDPNSNNPVVLARLRRAARSKGLYQLMFGASGGGATGAGFNPADFLDWFATYMKNESTPGAAPTITPQQAVALLNQAMTSAQDPSNVWSTMLLNTAGSDPATALGYGPEPGDRSNALNQLILSALGGLLDPSYLRALTEGTERKETDYITNTYDTGDTMPDDTSFLDFFMQNNPLFKVAGGQ